MYIVGVCKVWFDGVCVWTVIQYVLFVQGAWSVGCYVCIVCRGWVATCVGCFELRVLGVCVCAGCVRECVYVLDSSAPLSMLPT
jgi:hypothetical protein